MIASLSGPVFNSGQNIICNKWFGDKERGIATALINISIPLGSIVGFA
jgi:hypothetical protein